MKLILKHIPPTLALCLLTACADSTEGDTQPPCGPNGTKALIALSQEGSSITRALMTRAGFTNKTRVVVRIKAENTAGDKRYTQAVLTAGEKVSSDDHNSYDANLGEHSDLAYNTGEERYWDDAFGRDSKLTVYAVTVPEKNNNTVLSSNILDQEGGTLNDNIKWYTIGTESTTISWSVSAQQTAATRGNEDLAYSNNIKEGETAKGRYIQTYNSSTSSWDKSMDYGRLQWNPMTTNPGETTGKFDQGHLVFKHALSWIEINLKEGDESDGSGFDNNSSADFQWTNKPAGSAQAIALKGFPTNGKLDVSTGQWSNMETNVDITQLDETTPATPATQTTRTLHCYVLPGTNLYETSANVIEFEIDQAKYYATGRQIAEAIRNFYDATDGPGKSDPNAEEYRRFTETKAGKHYVINLKVGKKGITDITAAILDWETVNSTDAEPKNTYATFQFEDRTTRLTGGDAAKFDIYRAAKTATDYITASTNPFYDWQTGYAATPATKTWASDHWTTNWYWENNKTYCHFRAAGTGATASGPATITTDAAGGDYFTITSGEISGGTYKDYVWGAPFTYVDNNYKMKYDETNGFARNAENNAYQIAPGLPATDSQIKMLLFHETSQVFVNIRTTTDDYKVKLVDDKGTSDESDDDYTKVEILNFLPNGKVLMGNGAVSATPGDRTAAAQMTRGTYTAETGTGASAVAAQVSGYSYGIVPQPLSWTTPAAGTIGLRITTPDGNQYVVSDLSTCTATVSTTNVLNPYTLASGSQYTINAWYPHYQYTYTITIKKTAIQNITAAVLPWETITGDLGEINLEN